MFNCSVISIFLIFWDFKSVTRMPIWIISLIIVSLNSFIYLICIAIELKFYLLVHKMYDIQFITYLISVYFNLYCLISFLKLLNGLVIEHMFLIDFFLLGCFSRSDFCTACIFCSISINCIISSYWNFVSEYVHWIGFPIQCAILVMNSGPGEVMSGGGAREFAVEVN